MYAKKRLKTLAKHSVVPQLLAIASLTPLSPATQAACFGYATSTGCTRVVNFGAPTTGACQRPPGTPNTAVVRIIAGNLATNSLCTNTGANNPLAGTSVCVIEGGAGVDIIRGANTLVSSFPPIDAPTNIICGGGGDDIILGGTQNDVGFGDAGNDLLVGGKGTNYLSGGPGNDTLILGTPEPAAQFSSTTNANFNFPGESAGDRDVCQAGVGGYNTLPDCEIRLP